MQEVTLTGRICGDTEKISVAGTSLISFSVAVDCFENKEKVSVFWKVNCWNQAGQWEKRLPFLKKGTKVACIGSVKKPKTYDWGGETRIDLGINCGIIDFFNDRNNGSLSNEHRNPKKEYGDQNNEERYSEKVESFPF